MKMREESSDAGIGEVAADWFGRIREGELSNSDRKQFAQWLAESPVHVREYLGVSQTWGALKSAQDWPEQTSEQLFDAIRTAQAANVLPLKDFESPQLPSHAAGEGGTRGNARVRLYAVAAGLALLVLTAAWLWLGTERSVYSTSRGEQRSVVLPDGSVVQLNTLTRMVVHFEEGHRRIELPKGEAFFRVAHDSGRPFDVETPFVVVHAVGTEFNVYNRTDSTRVAVVEGKVTVTPEKILSPRERRGAGREAVRKTLTERKDERVISAGEQVTIAATGAIERTPKADTETQLATAWMQRRIVLDNDRIDTAIAEFNRYNKLQMQVADPQLAALRISGVFRADDPQALMKYLDEIQGVDIRSTADGFVLQRN